jgi:hypothetical protein
MSILAYIFLGFLSLTAIFITVAIIVENNFSEDHPVMKWWRKHVIGIAPDDWDI